MGILISKIMNTKQNLIVIFLVICIMQVYRFSAKNTKNNSKTTGVFQSQNPCQNLLSHPENKSLWRELLLHNCEPVLSPTIFQDHIFPKEIREQIMDFSRFYHVAFQKNSTLNALQIHSEDQKFIATLLEGDELRRIQNIHFLCTYPNLISQMTFPPNTVAKKTELYLLEHCQKQTLHTCKEAFFVNKENSVTSPYLDTLYEPFLLSSSK